MFTFSHIFPIYRLKSYPKMSEWLFREDLDVLLSTFNPYCCSRDHVFPSLSDSRVLVNVLTASSWITTYRLNQLQTSLSSNNRIHVDTQARMTPVQRYLDACLTITSPSPIRALPLELLSIIFGYCCSRPVILGRPSFQSGRDSIDALVLGSVCFRWRQLVRALPSLTSSLSILLPDNSQPPYKVVRAIENVLQMSQPNNELDLDLLFYSTPNIENTLQTSAEFPSNLLPHLPRIRRMSLEAYPQILLQPPQTFISLQSLIWFTHVEIAHEVDLTYAAPNLQSLDVTRDASFLKANWTRIRTLKLADCSEAYIVSMTRCCTHLTALHLAGCREGDTSAPLPHSVQIVLADLTDFRESHCSTKFLDYFASVIAMPSLIHCSLHYLKRSTVDFIISILRTAEYTVNHLMLHFAAYPPKRHLQSIIQASSMIMTLVLKLPRHEIPEGWDCMFFHEFQCPALPRLRVLELHLQRPGIDSRAFVAMVQSRWHTDLGRKLDSVLLELEPGRRRPASYVGRWDFDTKLWQTLQRLQMAGLRIHVEDSSGCVRTRVEEEERPLSLVAT